jgi:hypothetical protein
MPNEQGTPHAPNFAKVSAPHQQQTINPTVPKLLAQIYKDVSD